MVSRNRNRRPSYGSEERRVARLAKQLRVKFRRKGDWFVFDRAIDDGRLELLIRGLVNINGKTRAEVEALMSGEEA